MSLMSFDTLFGAILIENNLTISLNKTNFAQLKKKSAKSWFYFFKQNEEL